MGEQLGPFDVVVGDHQLNVIGRGSTLELILDFKQSDGVTALNLTGHTVGVHSSVPSSIKDNMTIEYTDRVAGRVTVTVDKAKFENTHVGELRNWFKPMIDYSSGKRTVYPRVFTDQYS